MASVLVVIIIPDKEYEDEVREKEQLSRRLHKNHKKDYLKTIKENDDNESKYPIEKIVEDGLSYLGIVDATWQKTKNDRYHQIIFPVDLEDSDVVIQYFKTLGIGLRLDTSIGIIPFSLFCYNEELNEIIEQEIILENGSTKDLSKSINNFKDKQSKFLKSVTARLTVAQVVDNVRSNATLTFDFVCYIIFASWIAAMGLLDNSVISLVASMLVSPMMGPLMALTLGTVIKDCSLIRMGIKNILVCFIVCTMFGFIFGMIALNFTDDWGDWVWPTDMMRERGLLRVTWVGTLVAFPSGCAVAISLLSGNEASLVGVAISVSLLPPCVNAGLLWAYSILRLIHSAGETESMYISQLDHTNITMRPSLMPNEGYKVVYNDNMAIETLILGSVSVLFSLVNITNIFLGAILLLKIKEIAPLATLSPENRRFFKEDIKIAREYNQNNKRGSNLGEDVLREWATIAGLDHNEFLRPEARAVQLQTLADIAKDVEADLVYQTVTKNIAPTENLTRRLSLAVTNNNNVQNNDIRRDSVRSATSVNQQHIVVTDLDSGFPRRPSSAGGNRRRISSVAYNNLQEDPPNSGRMAASGGTINNAFSFNESDINNHNQQMAFDKNRRYSSALLRRTLQTSEHSPYSLWPSTRNITTNFTSHDQKFTVIPVNENVKRLSNPQLNKFD